MIQSQRLDEWWTPELRAAGRRVFDILEPELDRIMREIYVRHLYVRPEEVSDAQVQRGVFKFEHVLVGNFSDAYMETQRRNTLALIESDADFIAYLLAYGYYQREGSLCIARHCMKTGDLDERLFDALHLALQCDTAVSIDTYFAEMDRVNAKKIIDVNDAATEKIKRVSTSIHRFSKQTTILAINATIEAARAGDAGRGFAVVASEIKNVSAAIQNATQEIERLAQTSGPDTEARL